MQVVVRVEGVELVAPLEGGESFVDRFAFDVAVKIEEVGAALVWIASDVAVIAADPVEARGGRGSAGRVGVEIGGGDAAIADVERKLIHIECAVETNEAVNGAMAVDIEAAVGSADLSAVGGPLGGQDGAGGVGDR